MRFGSVAVPCAALAMVLVVAGCGNGSTGPGPWSDPTTIEYYPGLHVNLARMARTTSGVFWWDSIPGSGLVAVQPGDGVNVRYTLWLPDGTLVDQQQTAAVTLQLVAGSTILGFIDGLSGAVQGTTRQLVIPPDQGYGAFAWPGIPPNSTLVFLVAVDQITPQAQASVASLSAWPGPMTRPGATVRMASTGSWRVARVAGGPPRR